MQGFLNYSHLFSFFDNNDGVADDSAVKIEGGFESSNIFYIKKTGKDHFEIKMRPDQPSDYKYPDHTLYWFYFKINGAKDRTITVDIMNCNWAPKRWDSYKPIYTYSEDPNDLSDHKWQKIENTERFLNVFRFTETFTSDTVYIALRYPYTYTYLQNYLNSIKSNPFTFIETIGKTSEDRNIYAIEVTDRAYTKKNKKTVLVLAKEHAVEQDGAWVIEGAINYLLSDDPKAVSLRANTVFVFLPVPAPDATFHGRTVNPVSGLAMPQRHSPHPAFRDRPAGMTVETKSIWAKIKRLAEDEGEIDIAINLHNPHGPEENVYASYYSTPHDIKKHERFNRLLFQYLNKYSTKITKPPTSRNKFIFLGRMSLEYKSLSLLYEINQHAKNSFLTIDDLHEIGGAFAKSVFDYYEFDY